jgi:hypothetical protein
MIENCELHFFEIELGEFYLFVLLDKLETVIQSHIFDIDHKLIRDQTFNITVIHYLMQVSNIEINFCIDVFEKPALFVCWVVMSIVENFLYFLFASLRLDLR